MSNTPLVNEALKLADAGFRVFPVTPGQKAPPRIGNWQNTASNDVDQVSQWWMLFGIDCNVAIMTKGLLVVDVDRINKVKDENGKTISSDPNPWEGAAKLAETGCPIAITATGGKHYFFRQPDGTKLSNTTHTLAPNVDTRADGGYVIAPGSVTIDGQYKWLVSPDECQIPEAPAWLMEQLTGNTHRSSGSQEKEHYTAQEVVAPGSSNREMVSLAGYMRRPGLSKGVIYDTLVSYDKHHCGTRKPVEEMQKIAEWAATIEPDQASEMFILGVPPLISNDGDDEAIIDPGFHISDPGPLPRHLLFVPGLIEEIVQYNLSGAHRPQSVPALAAALSLMAAITSGKIMEETGMRPNLYVIVTGDSGCGKDYGIKVNENILSAAMWDNLLPAGSIASGPALVTLITKSRCSLLHLDEFGQSLKEIKSKNAQTYQSSIISVLLKLYTSSSRTYISTAYADQDREPVRIKEPHVTLYGLATGDQVMQALGAESITDGLLPRLMIFEPAESDPYPHLRFQKQAPVPQTIVDQVIHWRDFKPGGNLCTAQGGTPVAAITKPIVVPYDQAGMSYLLKITKDVDDELNRLFRLNDKTCTLLTRVIEKTKKLAMLYACSRDHLAPVIDEPAVRWAFEIVWHQTQRVRYLASTRISSSQHDDEIKQVSRHIDEKFGGEIPEYELNEKLSVVFGVDKYKRIKASVCELLRLKFVEVKTKTKPRKLWRSPKHPEYKDSVESSK